MNRMLFAILLSLGTFSALEASPPGQTPDSAPQPQPPSRPAPAPVPAPVVGVGVMVPPELLVPPPVRQYRTTPRGTVCRQADGGVRIDTDRLACAEGERPAEGRRLSTGDD